MKHTIEKLLTRKLIEMDSDATDPVLTYVWIDMKHVMLFERDGYTHVVDTIVHDVEAETYTMHNASMDDHFELDMEEGFDFYELSSI